VGRFVWIRVVSLWGEHDERSTVGSQLG